ncbi:MAG TPA: TIGR02147 family protein [Deltaproteobacteria bacterium]|nr:TIGR02147 family protein [Deltaproteobacteria bacterium]
MIGSSSSAPGDVLDRTEVPSYPGGVRTGQLPSVFDFVSYRAFMRSWYEARKQVDRRFSHRMFARRAGVSSPSLFNEIVQGKRNLTSQNLQGFQRALGLSGASAVFFADLVALDQAPTEAERNAAWQRLSARRRFRGARSIEGAAFAYLSTWYFPAIRELALRPDFQPDPGWVARTLQPRIRPAQAREALDTLLELGLLVRRGDGGLSPAETSVATAHQVHDQVYGLAVHNYHRQMLERTIDAVEHVPSSQRHLVGITVAIPESLVPRLKAELDRMQERLLNLCDAHVDGAERVYQLELCLVPLSRGTEGPP